ncbi:MAG: maleate isomerase [Hyphomicrobiales bacterium]|jgi:maleate isomerase|nr:maleate isomerase [Hyphomicrobiales bacterium]
MKSSEAGWYRQQTEAIGTITPSGNIVVERVTTAILADFPEVSGHFSRIPVFGSSSAYANTYDWDSMMTAARLLSHAHLDVICWNGSKGVSLGFDAEAELCERITGETGIKATTSVRALDAVLRGSGVKSIGLVSPHDDAYQALVVAEFDKRGYRCIAEGHSGFSDNFSYSTVPDADIVAMIRKVAAAKPDAIVTFCTNFPAAHLVAPLEQETGIPIYDTTSIGVWDALRVAGVETARGARWGSLFTGP